MFSPLVGLVFLFLFTFKSVAGLHNVTIQENDPRIRYSDGGWTRVTDLSDKPTLLNCSDGLMETSIEGSFLEFNFTGTAVYFNIVDGLKGTFTAILDDKPFDVDPGITTTASCRVAYSQTGLTDEPHRLVVFNSGNPSSFLFDSITYTASDPNDYGNPPAGSIPQNDRPFIFVNVRPQSPRVTASGSWQSIDLTSIARRINFCADFAYQTSTIGSSLEFRFNGTAIEFNTFDTPQSRSIITVSIDGQNEIVDGHKSSEGCTLAWQRKNLSPNIEHVLRITNTGPADLDELSLMSIAMIRYSTKPDDPTVRDPNNNGPGLPLPTNADFIPYEDLPTNPTVIAGAVAAGIFVLCFLGSIFYWARRDRLKQAAMKLDEEKAISRQKWKDENDKKKSAGVSMGGDHLPSSHTPRQSHFVLIPPPKDDTPRSSMSLGDSLGRKSSSDGRPSIGSSSRKVGFLELPTPSRL